MYSGPKNLKKSRQKTREIAFLAVLNFFLVQKLIFWSILKLQKMEIDLFDFTKFFGMDFFKFSGPLCTESSTINPINYFALFL